MQRYNISSLGNRVLPEDYYLQNDVVGIAKDLLGKILISDIEGVITAGIITETEAYSHIEKGCHAYGKKKTVRNQIMFEKGGCAYVYLCYGIHHLFNVVTNISGEPEAVLIRGIYPVMGLSDMMVRRDQPHLKRNTFMGPGKVTQALGIDMSHNASSLISGNVRLIDAGLPPESNKIIALPRVGIEYAGKDALLPWRFILNISKEQ